MAEASIMVYGAGALSCFAFGTTLASQLLGRGRARKGEKGVPPPPAASWGRRPKRGQLAGAKFMAGSWEGFTMEDARTMADAEQLEAQSRVPAEVLAELQKGNVRFWTGTARGASKNAFERRALIAKQWPSTAVLGCSDSRVPTEIVFDQSLGDLFVVRVAGNCIATSTTASLQFAIFQLKVKVVMVMGHEGCGAVKAASQTVEAIEGEPEALQSLLKGLKGGLDNRRYGQVNDPRAHDREAVVTNVRRQVEQLISDDSIRSLVKKGELIIVGSFYEISSGIVDFLFEVSATSDLPPAAKSPSEAETETEAVPSRAASMIKIDSEPAPVDSAPVDSAPVHSAPVESAPVESAKIESAPKAGIAPPAAGPPEAASVAPLGVGPPEAPPLPVKRSGAPTMMMKWLGPTAKKDEFTRQTSWYWWW